MSMTQEPNSQGWENTAPSGPTQPAFKTVMRGLDRDQVLAHLKQMADRVEELENSLKQAEVERSEAERERDLARMTAVGGDPYDNASSRLSQLMRKLDQEVDRLRAEARAEVQRLPLEARAEADRIRSGATEEAERVRAEAATDAERIRSEARASAEQIQKEAQTAHVEARGRADSLLRDAQNEAERIKGELASLNSATMDDLRAIRDHMARSADELEGFLKGDRPLREDQLIVIQETDHDIVPAESGSQEQTPAGPELRP